MKRWILHGVVGFGVVGLLGSSLAGAQPPASFRPAPPSSGVGFFSRSYRAPGFSTIPAPPRYNAVSFYGRSFNAPGFSTVPSLPSYGAVSFYGRSNNAPGFTLVPSGQLVYTMGSYGSNYPVPSAPLQGSNGQGVSYGWHYGPSILSVYQPGVYSDYGSYALGGGPPS